MELLKSKYVFGENQTNKKWAGNSLLANRKVRKEKKKSILLTFASCFLLFIFDIFIQPDVWYIWLRCVIFHFLFSMREFPLKWYLYRFKMWLHKIKTINKTSNARRLSIKMKKKKKTLIAYKWDWIGLDWLQLPFNRKKKSEKSINFWPENIQINEWHVQFSNENRSFLPVLDKDR